MKWQKFELNVTEYLNSIYGDESLKFICKGGSDSTKSDIFLIHNDKNVLNIECKYHVSQSSQFVLMEDLDKKKFYFSPRNKSDKNDAKNLINHINDNYQYYSKKNSLKYLNNKLICDLSIIEEYVINNLQKKSSLIITSDFTDNFSNKKPLTISKVRDIPKNYNITGTYRTKQSGTRAAIINDTSTLPIDIIKKNDRLYIYDPNEKNNKYQDNHLFLSKVNTEGYREIRKRSSTYNANVIFNLQLKDDRKQHTCNNFLKNEIIQNTTDLTC